MKASVFEYWDYKQFINDVIQSHPKSGRGLRVRLAEAIHCQVPFVSHVLSGNYHFSTEQTEGVCRFFGLSKEESEYLILLVAYNRAGTQELSAFLRQVLSEKAEKHELLKNRLKIKETLNQEDQAIYYSYWHYGAIHMMLTIPRFQNGEAIAEYLGLPKKQVNEVLRFLVSCGMAIKEQQRYLPGNKWLHLERNSPFISQHHRNWRLWAMNSIVNERKHDLHYSAAFSCAEKDLPIIREKLSKTLEECAELIKASKEEKLASICLDLFEF